MRGSARVVARALLRVGEASVGRRDLLEGLVRAGQRALVRVQLQRELPIGLLQLPVVDVLGHLERLVVALALAHPPDVLAELAAVRAVRVLAQSMHVGPRRRGAIRRRWAAAAAARSSRGVALPRLAHARVGAELRQPSLELRLLGAVRVVDARGIEDLLDLLHRQPAAGHMMSARWLAGESDSSRGSCQPGSHREYPRSACTGLCASPSESLGAPTYPAAALLSCSLAL